MRGKGKRSITGAELLRITPAYAGKSASTRSAGRCTQDHPRLCGEKHHPKAPQKCKPGITPAYAGKSFVFLKSRPPTRDHPRLCGEK